MDKKCIKRLFCLLLIFIYLTGCSGVQPMTEPEAERQTIVDSATGEEVVIDSGGSISLSMGYPTTLNPLENKDLRVDRVLSLIFQPLFTLDDEMQPKPVLAQEYHLSADGLTMSVTLRDGLTWADGEPITAADIVFSLQTIKNADPASLYKPAMANVESCYQSSTLTAVINYSDPYGGSAYNLCIPLIPKHHYRHGNDFSPLGSGCYKMTDYREKHHMTLTATPASNKGMPYIQTINVMLAPDPEMDMEAFQTGMTDAIVTDLNSLGRMDTNREITATTYSSNQFEFIGFNFNQPVLKNNSFRQGLAYGIPLQDIVTDIYLGNATKSVTPVNPASALSAPAGVEVYEYNKELAQNMLAAAGYDLSKLRLSLLVNNDNNERMKIANIISDALGDLGITVDIEAVDFASYVNRLQKGDFQLYIGGTDLNKRIEPSALLGAGGSLNYGKYSDAHMNELLTACLNSTGDENYKKAVRELQAYCAQELPCIGIAFKASVLLTSSRIKGDKHPSVTGMFDNIEQWYISDDES